MASTRKSRIVNKKLSKINEESSCKDGTTTKSKLRKRKLSDMLGSQWSKEELERFYVAYRKYGKDWKKVASMTRNRSMEMVEALYNMNRAYLSLPEGTASVAGLIAMMTDHYNVLEGSDSERESNDGLGISPKLHKRGRAKVRLNNISKGSDGSFPDLFQCQLTSSTSLSLLKKKRSGGSRPRVVGKRTPRFPVAYSYDKDRVKIGSSIKKGMYSEMESNDDEVAHVVALALAEASHRGGSPQVSHTQSRRIEHSKLSAIQYGRRKHDTEVATVMSAAIDENFYEGSLGSREAENGDFVGNREGASAIKVSWKGKKFQLKKPEVQDFENKDSFDDVREACSGTEEGLATKAVRDEVETEVTNEKFWYSSPKGSRKGNRKLFTGDETTALDALQSLADLSLNMLAPTSTVESESSVQVKDEKRNVNVSEKPNAPDALSTYHRSDKPRISATKDRHNNLGADGLYPKIAELGKDLSLDVSSISEAKQRDYQAANKPQKRKRKSLATKVHIPEIEADSESRLNGSPKTEALLNERKEPQCKPKHAGEIAPLPKQRKSAKALEYSSSGADGGKPGSDIVDLPAQKSSTNQVSLPTRQRSKRKMDLQKELKASDKVGNEQSEKFSNPVFDGSFDLKIKLSHCLSSKKLRRWCAFEWFYSAIDYPWFTKNEFVAYLDHAQLGNLPSRLTRFEWGIIRSALGKPRRLSDVLLREERKKLEQYRENVRDTYTKLRAGIGDGLPTDLALPLSVGQRVIAWHPKTRELHDGSVLTVDRNRCRVQFDRPELGVELLMDIDCMPLNPLENMPETFRRQQNVAENCETKPKGQPMEQKVGDSLKYVPGENLENGDGLLNIASANYLINNLMKQAKGDTIDSVLQAKASVKEAFAAQAAYGPSCSLAEIQAREADIRALTDVSRALDKKDALLKEIRKLHGEVSLNQKDDGFRNQYARVVHQLKNTDEQVCSALLSLRERNTFGGNAGAPGAISMASTSLGRPAFFSQESGSHLVQILDSSRRKARTLVDIAVQAAASSQKEDGIPYVKVEEALDSANGWLCGSDPFVPAVGSFIAAASDPPGHCNSAHQDQPAMCPSEPPSEDPKQSNPCDRNKLQLPSELISSCVSTLLMIQTCTERQYPPGEVAQILECAVAGLHPYCSQNLPIYREIQTCMGIIKNQVLALIPTQSNTLPV